MTSNYKKMKQAKKNAKDKDLTPEIVKEIEKTFSIIDENNDGRISEKELSKAASLLGMNPTKEESGVMFKMADLDGDGYIDFEEYTFLMKQNYITLDQEKDSLRAAFRALDKNDDGFLTTDELKAALQHNSDITDEEIEIFVMEADKDGDGKINYEDIHICLNKRLEFRGLELGMTGHY